MAMAACQSPNALRISVDISGPGLTDADRTAFMLDVHSILEDDQGWKKSGITFCPAMGNHPDFDIILALPDEVDRLCDPIKTNGEVSCAHYESGVAVINYERWTKATPAWKELEDYRRYVINHEVGHLLGMDHRHRCTKSGKAPLMMQQSRKKVKCETNSLPTSHEVLTVKREIGEVLEVQ